MSTMLCSRVSAALYDGLVYLDDNLREVEDSKSVLNTLAVRVGRIGICILMMGVKPLHCGLLVVDRVIWLPYNIYQGIVKRDGLMRIIATILKIFVEALWYGGTSLYTIYQEGCSMLELACLPQNELHLFRSQDPTEQTEHSKTQDWNLDFHVLPFLNKT